MEHSLIFTFSGDARAGKDTCAMLLKNACEEAGLSCFNLAFGDAVKYNCARNFDYKNKDTDRHILQEFGTKVREIEKDFWVRQVYMTIDMLRNEYDVFAISDARYENELQPFPFAMLYPIINVYVKRDFETTLSEDEYNHESESMAHNPDMSKFQYVIDNNGTLQDTYKQIVDMLINVFNEKSQLIKDFSESSVVDE